MKTDKNFKLSKSAKRVLATIPNKDKRGLVKKMHIEAEVLEAHAKATAGRPKDKAE